MSQQDIELELVENISQKDRAILEEIARSVSHMPLITGEIRFFTTPTSKKRLEEMLAYIQGKRSEVINYLVKSKRQVIGYVGVWTGWTAMTMTELDPRVEMAFVSPDYQNEADNIKEKIPKILRETKNKYSEGS